MNPIRPSLSITTDPDFLHDERGNRQRNAVARHAQLSTRALPASDPSGSNGTLTNGLSQHTARSNLHHRHLPSVSFAPIPMEREARLTIPPGRFDHRMRRIFFSHAGEGELADGVSLPRPANDQVANRRDHDHWQGDRASGDRTRHSIHHFYDPLVAGGSAANHRHPAPMPNADSPPPAHRTSHPHSPVFNGSLTMMEFFLPVPDRNPAANGSLTAAVPHGVTEMPIRPIANHHREFANGHSHSDDRHPVAPDVDQSSSGDEEFTSYRHYLEHDRGG